jgi:bacteriorhodopsin
MSQEDVALQQAQKLSVENFIMQNSSRLPGADDDVASQASFESIVDISDEELQQEMELMELQGLNSSYVSEADNPEVRSYPAPVDPSLLVRQRKQEKSYSALTSIEVAPPKPDALSDTGSSEHSHGSINITRTPLARAVAEKMITRKQRLRELHTPYLDHYSHVLCWYTQYMFTIATIILFYFATFHDQKEKFIRTFFVVATAALAYYAKCSGIGEANLFGNERVPWVRYVDWILTTPIMLSELCHIGHAPDDAYDMIIGCDLLMLSCGIASALIPGHLYMKQKCFYFFCGSIFFSIMVFVLHRDVANGSAKHQSTHIQNLFQNLNILTIVVWSLYPLLCGLGRAHSGLISVAAEDAIICLMDMAAKIGMEGLVIVSVLTDPGVANWDSVAGVVGQALNTTATVVAENVHHLR